MLEYSDQEFYVEACRGILRLRDKHHYEHIKSFDQFDLREIWKLLSDCDSPSYCPVAKHVRNVRDTWVHADCDKWDKAELDKIFRAMEEFVRTMCSFSVCIAILTITRFWIRHINRKVSSHYNACGTRIRKEIENRNTFVFGICSSLRDIWNYWEKISIPFEFILKSPLALIKRPLNYNQTQDKLYLWFIYCISLNFKLECGAFITLLIEVEFLIGSLLHLQPKTLSRI